MASKIEINSTMIATISDLLLKKYFRRLFYFHFLFFSYEWCKTKCDYTLLPWSIFIFITFIINNFRINIANIYIQQYFFEMCSIENSRTTPTTPTPFIFLGSTCWYGSGTLYKSYFPITEDCNETVWLVEKILQIFQFRPWSIALTKSRAVGKHN